MAEPALQAVPRMGCLHGISLGPGDPGLITRAAWAALQRRDINLAIRSFRAALASGPADRASAHLDLGEAYFAAGQRDDAKREALAALEIAPSFERAQDLLLKLASAPPGASR